MGLRDGACHKIPNRSICAARAQRLAMQRSALRLYRCARCGQVALVCSGCEHGQIYCASGCAKQARLESQRRAGARHQRTKEGRHNHADRQARYRLGPLQKVTHQGAPVAQDLVQPRTSGPCVLLGLPEKESSDVCPPALLHLPCMSSGAEATPVLESLPGLAGSSFPSTTRLDLPESPQHCCHFCAITRSRYLRRDFLCFLRRRHLGRRKKESP